MDFSEAVIRSDRSTPELDDLVITMQDGVAALESVSLAQLVYEGDESSGRQLTAVVDVGGSATVAIVVDLVIEGTASGDERLHVDVVDGSLTSATTLAPVVPDKKVLSLPPTPVFTDGASTSGEPPVGQGNPSSQLLANSLAVHEDIPFTNITVTAPEFHCADHARLVSILWLIFATAVTLALAEGARGAALQRARATAALAVQTTGADAAKEARMTGRAHERGVHGLIAARTVAICWLVGTAVPLAMGIYAWPVTLLWTPLLLVDVCCAVLVVRSGARVLLAASVMGSAMHAVLSVQSPLVGALGGYIAATLGACAWSFLLARALKGWWDHRAARGGRGRPLRNVSAALTEKAFRSEAYSLVGGTCVGVLLIACALLLDKSDQDCELPWYWGLFPLWPALLLLCLLRFCRCCAKARKGAEPLAALAAAMEDEANRRVTLVPLAEAVRDIYAAYIRRGDDVLDDAWRTGNTLMRALSDEPVTKAVSRRRPQLHPERPAAEGVAEAVTPRAPQVMSLPTPRQRGQLAPLANRPDVTPSAISPALGSPREAAEGGAGAGAGVLPTVPSLASRPLPPIAGPGLRLGARHGAVALPPIQVVDDEMAAPRVVQAAGTPGSRRPSVVAQGANVSPGDVASFSRPSVRNGAQGEPRTPEPFGAVHEASRPTGPGDENLPAPPSAAGLTGALRSAKLGDAAFEDNEAVTARGERAFAGPGSERLVSDRRDSLDVDPEALAWGVRPELHRVLSALRDAAVHPNCSAADIIALVGPAPRRLAFSRRVVGLLGLLAVGAVAVISPLVSGHVAPTEEPAETQAAEGSDALEVLVLILAILAVGAACAAGLLWRPSGAKDTGIAGVSKTHYPELDSVGPLAASAAPTSAAMAATRGVDVRVSRRSRSSSVTSVASSVAESLAPSAVGSPRTTPRATPRNSFNAGRPSPPTAENAVSAPTAAGLEQGCRSEDTTSMGTVGERPPVTVQQATATTNRQPAFALSPEAINALPAATSRNPRSTLQPLGRTPAFGSPQQTEPPPAARPLAQGTSGGPRMPGTSCLPSHAT